jgi:hypothetical protein
MITISVKLAATVTCVGLACPGIANAELLPGVEDFPDIDETFALNYASDHDREVCRILDRRLPKGNPSVLQLDSAITEVAEYGGFNYDTATFVIGVAMAKNCGQHVKQFESALGVEIA